jgi:hypothetical protein
MTKKNQKLTNISKNDFSFIKDFPKYIEDKLNELDLKYRFPNNKERDEAILENIKYLIEEEPVVAGDDRINIWENGWSENLEEYKETGDLLSIAPKYLGKHKIQRLNGKFIIPESENFEIHLVSIFQLIIFDKYLKEYSNIYEFGAGTGHNLLRVRSINKNANLYSMEWTKAGVDLINYVAKDLNDDKLFGILFDNTKPNYDIKLGLNSAVYTFAALEQLGDRTDKIIDYWLTNKPAIIINIEPMREVLDNNELLQYLSSQYCKKRGYIKSYTQKLKSLENKGLVKVHEIIKPNMGGLFIDNYSIVIWSPTSGKDRRI